MRQFNPMHPGAFIRRVYLEPSGLSVRMVAERLGVAASTFSRLVKEESSVTPDMAIRLSRVLGRSAKSWLMMQLNHDLWQAEQVNQHEDLQSLKDELQCVEQKSPECLVV